MNGDKIFQRNKALPWRQLGDEGIIIDNDPETVHVANESAIRIWSFLDGSHSLNDIAKKLSDEFDVTKEIALSDVFELVEQLKKKELISDASLA